MNEILNALSIINKSVILSSIFERFLILEPYDDIANFMQNNQHIFNENGWKLSCIEYKHPKRGLICKDCLEITPM